MRYGILLPALALLALSACGQSDGSSGTSSAPVTSSAATNSFKTVRYGYTTPGVLIFGKPEAYRSTGVETGTIMALYPITMQGGTKGQLIIVKIDRHDRLYSVAQPNVDAFTLHKGETIIMVGSRGQNRILPYQHPAPAPGTR